MQNRTIIFIGAGLVIMLLMAGLWLVYYSDRPQPPPVAEKPRETHSIDFTARVEGSPDQDISDADPEDGDVTALPHEDEYREKSADQVLEEGFINNLAQMIFENYFPAQGPGQPARFMLSFKMINMHYGTDFSDFKVDDRDILEARQEVMQYLFQPVVVDAAARIYGAQLIERIVHLAENRERLFPDGQDSEDRLLTRVETAELLRLFSRRLSYLAHVFERSATGDEVQDLVNDYLRTVDELREVYFEYWQLDEEDQELEGERLGMDIKSLIEKRENIREEILSRVATTDMLKAGHDYVYEAQWVYRRIRIDDFPRDSILSLANAGKMVSAMALERAEIVLEGV